MSARLRRVLPPAVGLVLFVVALVVLRRELRATDWHALVRAVFATSRGSLALAVLLTVANYAALTGYDFLAFAYIGKKLSAARVVVASFLAYAIANNVGFAMISGASVRYRFYTRWGVTAEELSRVVFSYAVTFWLGLLLLGGLSLATTALPVAIGIPAAPLLRVVGTILAAACVAYVVATVIRRDPIRLGRFQLPMPSPRLALAQLAVSSLDWTIAASVLYVLLPASNLSFLGLLGAFVAAQLLGLASHVPGGVGVFDSAIVLLLSPFLASSAVLPALFVYRAVYYLLPLAVAVVALVADEVHQRRAQAARVGALLGRLSEELAPRVLAFFTFLSGAILLISGALPTAGGRLSMLNEMLPLGVIEASHFLGSVLGAALLLLSQGLARRLDAAYWLALTAIAMGIVSSLLKGARYEEAMLLALVLVVLWSARPAFDRRAAFFDTRFSTGWVLAIIGTLTASVWIGLFAFRHVEYSQELWWQFELHGEASRFLRGSVGAAVLLLLVAFARLIEPAPHEVVEPDDAALARARTIVERQPATTPYLAFLRDKALLFNADSTGFVMYGVQGRTWVALGDPVGPPEVAPDLIRLFLERCDDFDGVPVFYEVGKDQLHKYADFGLTFVKLGEEARVDLAAFSLEGGQARKHRQVLRRLEEAGATFRIVPPPEVPAVIGALRAVSDDWLASKSGGEKGFSLGSFDPDYLARFQIAVVEQHGRIVAFTNVFAGAEHRELSCDLMRYHRDGPPEAMEALLLQVMVWGKAQGYRWFSLGMAPLSGFEHSPIAPLWTRLGSFLYKHGDAFYHFQGLRAYKEKFHPVWEPRYLVYPGGFRLPRILADVSALVAGGYRKVLLK